MQSKKLIRMKFHEGFIIYPVIGLFTLICIIPFIIMLSGSFTSDYIIRYEGISLLPREFTFAAYEYLFEYPDVQLGTSYGITIAVSVIGTFLNLLLCVLIAYPLSDINFRYRRIISFILFFSMIFNAGLIPLYIFIRRVYFLYNTYAILVILPMAAPGHIFFLRIFFQSVPKALYESARIDGANEYRILFRIGLPVIRAGIAAILFQFMLMYWNDPTTALWFTDNITPIALYTQRWQSYIEFLKLVQQGLVPGVIINTDVQIPDQSVRLAMAVLSTLPMLIIFSLFQKHFIGGLSTGAVKG